MKNDSLKGQHRINEQIRAKEVRIVGDEVEPLCYSHLKKVDILISCYRNFIS